MDNQYSVLNSNSIKYFLKSGEITIHPFNERQLNTTSYDVTLGEYFYREQHPKDEWCSNIYNINSKTHVDRVWGKAIKALPYTYYKKLGIKLENIKDNDHIIWINPQETILGHTQEFIGGKSRVTTMMKCRSSLGRSFIETCKCSGWGDINFRSRWTMEITNNSTFYKIPLIVKHRIAQIVFLDTGSKVDGKTTYDKIGKYQKGTNVEDIIKNWKPEHMLPKLYLDYENTEQN